MKYVVEGPKCKYRTIYCVIRVIYSGRSGISKNCIRFVNQLRTLCSLPLDELTVSTWGRLVWTGLYGIKILLLILKPVDWFELKFICGYKISVKNEYIMLNYLDDRKYFIYSVTVYCIQAEKLRVYRCSSRWIFLLRKLGSTHIPFLENLFLMLTESNSRNLLSEIITTRKITDKNLPFSVGFFSPNIVALFVYLKSNSLLQLLCDFPKGSSVPLSLWILNLLDFSASSLGFGQSFIPKQWILSFLSKVLLQIRHLSSSLVTDQLKKEEDSVTKCCNLPCDIHIISFVQSIFSHSFTCLKLFPKDVKLEMNQYVNSRLLFTDPNKFVYLLYIIQLLPGSYN